MVPGRKSLQLMNEQQMSREKNGKGSGEEAS